MDFKLLMSQVAAYLHKQAVATGQLPGQAREESLQTALENQPVEAPVDSSWVESGAYDPQSATLELQLLDGHRYLYYNISQARADQFFLADSPGEFVNDVLKAGFFPFTKLE